MIFVIKHEHSRLSDNELSSYLSEMVAHASRRMDSSALQFNPVFSSETYSVFDLIDSTFRPDLRGLSVAIVDFSVTIVDDNVVVPLDAIIYFKKLGGDMAHLHYWLSGGVISDLDNFEILPIADRGALCLTWSTTYVTPDSVVNSLMQLPELLVAKH